MDQNDVVRLVVDVLEELGIRYMLVGSFASTAYGEPRLTQDVDFVIDLSYGLITPLCSRFSSPEYYVSIEAAGQAVRTGGQFNIIHPASGNKIDLMIMRHGSWQEEEMDRRQRLPVLAGREVFVARPEDVILGKMMYYVEGQSPKHLQDIAGILKVSGEQVDMEYVRLRAQRMKLEEIWDTILSRVQKQ